MEQPKMEKDERSFRWLEDILVNFANYIYSTYILGENNDDKTRKIVVVAQEQETQHEWDSKFLLPRLEEFHSILVFGVKQSWKILLQMTAKSEMELEFILYLNEISNYLLLVVSCKFDKKQMVNDSTIFSFGEKIKKQLLKFKSKPTLLITGNGVGGYIAQIITHSIKHRFVDQNGDMQIREAPSEEFITYTVVFNTATALLKLQGHDASKCCGITNVISPSCNSYIAYLSFVDSYFYTMWKKRFSNVLEEVCQNLGFTYKLKTSEGLVEWERKQIPFSFFTKKTLKQMRKYLFLAPMCPELVEKIPKCRLLDSYILLEDEDVTPEEFIPKTNQVLSKFKDVIDSEMFADKHLKELYKVLTVETRKDTHCLIMNEEGKRSVQQWPDGTVIRGFKSYEEMRFYACLYYNSIQKCYYCSYEKFIQINAEMINNFASKTKPTIILIVDEDQNIQFQHQTYENMKIIYLVLELDVEKTNKTLHISILDKKSQRKLKATRLNYFGNKVEAWKVFGRQLFQELRIFEIYDFAICREQKKPYYVNDEITCKNSTETFESATELVNRIHNGEPKFVVISGEAGTGKSTTLKKIAYELQKKQENFWIVYLDSSQIECQLTEAHTLDSEVAAVELVRNLELDKLKGNKEVLRKLFDHKLKMFGMVLLIDSFDQISPEYKGEANNFIKILRQTGLQMIVTTRPNEDINFSAEEETFELELYA